MSEYEQERVLCEDCGQSDAVCTVAVMMGSQVVHRRLCQACMAKASMSIATGNLGQVLGTILAAARNAAQRAQEAQEAVQPDENALPEIPGEAEACSRCGMTYEAYRKTGRLGCAECCTAFRQTLVEALRRDAPQARHTGRQPLTTDAALRSRAQLETLQRQLEEAVAREDYEAAAAFDAEMRELTGGSAR